MGIRLAVILSDVHAGGSSALCPPDFETLEGQRIGLSPVQRWLWESWQNATDVWLPAVTGADPFLLIVNGDLVEGVHHKGREVISSDPADHAIAAEQILAPLAKRAAKTIVVEGTETHTGSAESGIGKALGAMPHPSTGKFAWHRADVEIAGTRIVAQHHIATSMRTWTEATGLGTALANEQLEAARNGEPLPRVLMCAHRHRFGQWRDASGLCIVTPPWQLLTRFARKVVPSARTRPGMVVLDWRGKGDGELPEVEAVTYSPKRAGFVEV